MYSFWCVCVLCACIRACIACDGCERQIFAWPPPSTSAPLFAAAFVVVVVTAVSCENDVIFVGMNVVYYILDMHWSIQQNIGSDVMAAAASFVRVCFVDLITCTPRGKPLSSESLPFIVLLNKNTPAVASCQLTGISEMELKTTAMKRYPSPPFGMHHHF